MKFDLFRKSTNKHFLYLKRVLKFVSIQERNKQTFYLPENGNEILSISETNKHFIYPKRVMKFDLFRKQHFFSLSGKTRSSYKARSCDDKEGAKRKFKPASMCEKLASYFA